MYIPFIPIEYAGSLCTVFVAEDHSRSSLYWLSCLNLYRELILINRTAVEVVDRHTIESLCPKGEQCNIVPDNVDDIVADMAQEEKEEGQTIRPSLSLSRSLLKEIESSSP